MNNSFENLLKSCYKIVWHHFFYSDCHLRFSRIQRDFYIHVAHKTHQRNHAATTAVFQEKIKPYTNGGDTLGAKPWLHQRIHAVHGAVPQQPCRKLICVVFLVDNLSWEWVGSNNTSTCPLCWNSCWTSPIIMRSGKKGPWISWTSSWIETCTHG